MSQNKANKSSKKKKINKNKQQRKRKFFKKSKSKGNHNGKKKNKQKNNQNHKNNGISQQTMKDHRFQKVFYDPSFQAIPNRKKNPNKVLVDDRFKSMFSDKAFQTGYRIDRYGREILNNEAYDLRKYYQLNDDNDDDDGYTHTEGYEAEDESDESDDDNKDNNDKAKAKAKPKISKTIQKQIDKFKSDQKELDENDSFWDTEWDDDNKNTHKDPLSVKEKKLLNRKAGNMFDYNPDDTTSSSEEDYSYDKLNANDVGDDVRAVLDDNDTISQDIDPTNRLAIVNCDWDNLHASDLYMIFRSFLPPQGSIIKISIHPSDYGVKQMEKEQAFGPDITIWNNGKLSNDVKDMENAANFIDDNENRDAIINGNDNNDDDKSDESEIELDPKAQKLHHEMDELQKLQDTIHAIKQGRAGDVLENEIDTVFNKQALRKYELQKLRYYYAIAEFDSVNTTDRLFQELNNREFRHTCNVLSLSFVEKDFVAPHDPIDVCTDIPDNYVAASDKQTNALGSTYVELTWDKTDPNRIEQCQRAFTAQQLNDMDLDAYLQEDDDITDAGFDTDFPVTDYDTDTPNKKILIKRRARNRYQDILKEFKEMEDRVRGSDDASPSESETDNEQWKFNTTNDNRNDDDSNDDKDDDIHTTQTTKAMKDRLQKKRLKELNRVKQVKLNIDNLSSSSSGSASGSDDDNGNKQDTFDYDNELTSLNQWIDAQKQLKQTINTINIHKNSKKRSRDQFEQDDDDDDSDDEPLVQNDDMDPNEMNDPYFRDVHDTTYMDNNVSSISQPPKKKQKLNNNNDIDNEKEKMKRRALLEMMMATDDDKIKYDPENNEIDQEILSKRLNSRIRRNWRLEKKIKKQIKKKLAEQDQFQYNYNDDRFNSLHDDPTFAIDPTNKSYRNTIIMKELLKKTRKKRSLNGWKKNNINKLNKNRNLNKNKQTASSIDTNSLIQSLKTKSAMIPKLQDAQSNRKNITKKLRQKGLSSFHRDVDV